MNLDLWVLRWALRVLFWSVVLLGWAWLLHGCAGFQRHRAIDDRRNGECVRWCDRAAGRLTTGICEPDGTCVCDTGEFLFRREWVCDPMMLVRR